MYLPMQLEKADQELAKTYTTLQETNTRSENARDYVRNLQDKNMVVRHATQEIVDLSSQQVINDRIRYLTETNLYLNTKNNEMRQVNHEVRNDCHSLGYF